MQPSASACATDPRCAGRAAFIAVFARNPAPLTVPASTDTRSGDPKCRVWHACNADGGAHGQASHGLCRCDIHACGHARIRSWPRSAWRWVIGNSAYQHTAPLRNPEQRRNPTWPPSCAELGFDVIDGIDLTKAEMEEPHPRLRRQARRLRCRSLLLCRPRPRRRRQEFPRPRRCGPQIGRPTSISRP